VTGADPLARAIHGGVPLLVLSPHLDDAALSCGALIADAAAQTAVTVVTLFTEAGPPPYTLSARRYLRQTGARDARALYRQRRDEDQAALESLGVSWAHAGLIEAQHRRRKTSAGRSTWWAALLPELEHTYPVYRLHVTAGRLAAADTGTLRTAIAFVRWLAGRRPALVLAPLAIGGHVDHVLARAVAQRSGAPLVYYSDFPYNQHHVADKAFIRGNRLCEVRGPQPTQAKADLIRSYGTQARALFPDGRIPLVPEVFYWPGTEEDGDDDH
jgi:LmbE family N-acetylglucosaminyl deacetylase